MTFRIISALFLAEKFYEQTIFLISFYTGSFNAPWPQPVGMEVLGRLLVRRIWRSQQSLIRSFNTLSLFPFSLSAFPVIFPQTLWFMCLTIFNFFSSLAPVLLSGGYPDENGSLSLFMRYFRCLSTSLIAILLFFWICVHINNTGSRFTKCAFIIYCQAPSKTQSSCLNRRHRSKFHTEKIKKWKGD